MSDLEIIGQIENELKVWLKRLDDIKWSGRGYILNPSGQVTGLGLSGCKIGNLNRIIFLLKSLINLRYLDLRNNQIIDISSLSNLINLRQLYLRNNKVSNVYSLTSLTNLMHLDLSYNKMTDIYPFSGLTNLTQLDLSSNQISDIYPLKGLINLTLLDLHYNQIEELPSWITDFKMEIRLEYLSDKEGYITLLDNPLKTPPPEIVKQGKEAVRNYFEQLKSHEQDYIFEAKLLIVGEPGAGKTTLARKIENSDYELRENEKSTEGIEVIRYEFPLENNKTFRINIWDFGGQEIYKATHQFFLTKRSLYALVADSREENTDFYYWLNIAQLLSDNSPLLIVKNEKQDRLSERFGSIH